MGSTLSGRIPQEHANAPEYDFLFSSFILKSKASARLFELSGEHVIPSLISSDGKDHPRF